MTRRLPSTISPIAYDANGAVITRSWRPFYGLIFALALLTLQILSGTGSVYAALVFALLLMTYVAVRCAGGLDSLFGLVIFYLLLQHVLISQAAMIYFWEPADAPLRQPIITMGVYVVGMASLALGALMANRFRRGKRPLFVAETRPSHLFWLCVLTTLFSILMLLAIRTVGVDATRGGPIQGGILGPLKQIGLLGPLAFASGTAYIIKTSGGRRSFGLMNGIPMLAQMVLAVLGGNREGGVDPVIIYVFTCIAFHYRFRPKHYIALCIGAYVATYIFFPYALIARNVVRTGSIEKNISRSLDLLAEIIENPLKYHDQLAQSDAKSSRAKHQFDYYSHPSATLGRYTILPVTDGLVDATLSQGMMGMTTITPGFEAVLPRFINPDKPFVQTGNFLAHRVPGLSPAKNDHTTGITTGFFADAFSSYGWLGIALIPCLLIFCVMTIFGFLVNPKIWENVLMLSLVMSIVWGFSEGTIANIILLCTVGALATGVGILVLYALTDVLYRITSRSQNALASSVRRRHQVLQRTLVATSDAGKPTIPKQASSKRFPSHE